MDRFAHYYFIVLDAETDPGCPPVWRDAFVACRPGGPEPLRLVLLGMNAHINHDLPLALADVLTDWPELDEATRRSRHEDHERVNTIIARTTDALQEQVVNTAMPAMRVLDTMLGGLDEALFTQLVSQWRERGWDDAQRIMQCTDEAQRQQVRADIHRRAHRWATLIAGGQH